LDIGPHSSDCYVLRPCKGCPLVSSKYLSFGMVQSGPHVMHGSLDPPHQKRHQDQSIRFAWPQNMDGSIVFARWQQCAPHVMHAFLAKPSPQAQQHLDRFGHFAQVTAESRYTLQRTSDFSPHNCPFPWGPERHLTYGSYGLPES